MAKLEKTIVIKTDTSGAKKGIAGLEKDVKGVGEGAKGSQGALKGMAGSTKALGMAMKAAGIGLVTALLVGFGNALSKNQKVMDVFNIGMEMFNLTFQRLISFYEESVDMLMQNEALMGFFQSRVQNLTNIFNNSLNFALNNFNIAMKTASVLWNASPFGDGSTSLEDLKNLGGEMLDFAENQKNLFQNQLGELETFVNDQIVGATEGFDFMTKRLAELKKEFIDGETNIQATATALVTLKNKVKEAEAEQRRLQLTYQKDAEIQRQIRDDVSRTIDERIEANEKLGKVLEEQTQTEKANAQLAVDLAQLQLDQNKGNIDLQIALKNAKTELLDIEERIIGQQSEQKTNENALHQERIANMAELSAIGKSELEASLNALDIEAEKRKELAKRTIQNEQELQAMLLLIEEDAQTKKDKIQADADAEAERERKAKEKEAEKAKDKAIKDEEDIKNAKIKAAKDILNATTAIAGEGSKVAKAAAVSNILIDTALAISGAVKAAQNMPFPGNLAAVATGIATVMANLRTAKSILSKAGAGDGGDISVDAVGGTPAMGGIGGTIPNINAIGSPQTNMQPVQAFVVENDISDAQALQEELDIQATL